MRKSNSKEARRAVEAYVMECVQDVNERMEQADSPSSVSAAFDTLKSEMRYQSSYNGKTAVFGAGLAEKYRSAGRFGFISATTPYLVWSLAVDAGCFDVYYDAMRQHLARWLDETPEEADVYSNDAVKAQYCHMTAQAFERLYERETTPRRNF